MSHKTTDIPDFCYLQVSIAGQVQPKPIVIKLHKEACPKTCRNFVALCTHNDQTTSPQRPVATYCGSHFHRIIPNFMCQAGDFERFDGTGGYSPIYQGGRFNDENLNGKHDQEGVVSMANAGKNTNKSQFFITLKATPHLDGKHVVFGQVVSGMESVRAMTTVEREGDRPVPLQRIVISDCGVGMGNKKDNEKDKDESWDRKKSKKKRKKHKSKRRYRDDDDDDSHHRDRKKRKKHHRSRRKDDDSVSSSNSSSSNSSNGDSRDRDRSRHHKKHRSRSKDRHERKKHSSSSRHRKRSRSSKRKRDRRSDSRSSSESRSYSSDSRDRRREHGRKRKHKH